MERKQREQRKPRPKPVVEQRREAREREQLDRRPATVSSVVGEGWVEHEPGIYYRVDLLPPA